MSLKVFLLVAVAVISAVAAWDPLDPEETLFIYTRCMEDHLPDDDSRKETLEGWKDWNLVPTDKTSTQCYARCVITKMGLYDPGSKKFNAEVIKKQWNAYKDLADESSVNKYAEAVGNLPQTEDDCEQVFNTYNGVHTEHKSTSRNIFHGNPELINSVYAKLGDNVRQRNQSYFVFCENKNYPIGSPNRNQLCQIRQYAILDDEQFNKHTDCIFRGLRYTDENNQLDRSEIKRDFEQANKDSSKVDAVLDGCGEPGSDNVKAVHYYKCLVQSAIVDDFKEAFDYREVRSQNYAYHLWQKQAYNKPNVAAQVMDIDGKQCPS